MRRPTRIQITALWSRLEEKWNEIQVGRQGSYSIERLESLDHYCQTTSRAWAILVCVLTPLPALAFTVLLECLPLRPPSEGWAANWMFWVRVGLLTLVVTIGGTCQTLAFAPGLIFPLRKRIIGSVCVSLAQVGTWILAAKLWIFPIPFAWQLGAIPMSIYMPIMMRLAVGSAPFASDSPIRPHLQRHDRFFGAHMVLIMIYPLCKAIYDSTPAVYRVSAIIFLPLWKVVSKQFILHASREVEDFMPELVAFSVDFFSVLFVSVCMSTSGSILLSVFFICIDVGQTLLEFREVRMNATSLLQLIQSRNASRRNPRAYSIKSLEDARLWACPPHNIPENLGKNLQDLEDSGVYGTQGSPSNRITSSGNLRRQRRISHRVHVETDHQLPSAPRQSSLSQGIPAATSTTEHNPLELQAFTTPDKNADDESAAMSNKLVLQGLQLLFHCEYLILVEYVECIVPLLYLIYKSALAHLPNVVFFPGGAANWGVQSVTNLLTFAALEAGSFILLNTFFQRKFAFSPLFQLAYVLETQMFPVQAKLFLEMVVLLQYELEHLGTDFTFQFKWLHQPH